MLERIRKNVKIVIYIVAVAFILTIIFDWGMNFLGMKSGSAGKNVVGKIDGKEITYEQYNQAIQQAYMEIKNQNPDREITDQEMEAIKEQAWNNLINAYVIQDMIRENNITVTDEEIASYIRYSPPPEVQNFEQFQTDGKFDIQKYQSFLGGPNSDQFIQQVEYLFRSNIPEQKLFQRFYTSINITDEELKSYYHLNNDKAKVKYLKYSINSIPDNQAQIDSAEVKAGYQKNKEQYKDPENLALKVFEIRKTLSPEDSAQAKEKIEKIKKRIEEGEDFGQLAKTNSDDKNSAKNNGDIGYISPKDIKIEAFKENVFGLDSGEVSKPFLANNAWNIVKCEGIRNPSDSVEEYRCKQIVINLKLSSKSLSKLRSKAEDVIKTIHQKKVKTVKEDSLVRVIDLEQVYRNAYFLPQIGMLDGLPSFLKITKDKHVANRIFENKNAFYVIYTVKVNPESISPLEKVYKQIETKLKNEKKANILYSQIKNLENKQVEQIEALDPQKTVDTTSFFTRNDYLPGIGKGNEFIGAAFALQQGQISDLIKVNNNYFILQVQEKQVKSNEEIKSNLQEIKNEYETAIKRLRFQQWFLAQKEKHEIEDLRSNFF